MNEVDDRAIPAVSVVIAAYNGASTVMEAITSARQSFDNSASVEVVVVDDGSTDETSAVLDGFGEKIRVLRQENRGAAVARTVGGATARGEWLVFLDADDVLLPGGLESLLVEGERSKADVVYGAVRENRGRGMEIRFHEGAAGPPPWPARALFWKNLIPAPGAVLVRRSLFDRVGGFSKDQPSDDRNFWLRCGVFGTFQAVSVPVLEKRIQPASVSHRRDRSVFHQYWYLLDYLDWCRSHWIDTRIFSTSKAEIIERGLCHALEEKAYFAFRALLYLARLEAPRSPVVKIFWRHRWFARWLPNWVRGRPGLPLERVSFGRPLPSRET